MSASVVVDVDLPSIRTFAGVIVAEGSLRVEVPPHDLAAGHRSIDQLAERAHAELTRAAADTAEPPAQGLGAKAAAAAERITT